MITTVLYRTLGVGIPVIQVKGDNLGDFRIVPFTKDLFMQLGRRSGIWHGELIRKSQATQGFKKLLTGVDVEYVAQILAAVNNLLKDSASLNITKMFILLQFVIRNSEIQSILNDSKIDSLYTINNKGQYIVVEDFLGEKRIVEEPELMEECNAGYLLSLEELGNIDTHGTREI